MENMKKKFIYITESLCCKEEINCKLTISQVKTSFFKFLILKVWSPVSRMWLVSIISHSRNLSFPGDNTLAESTIKAGNVQTYPEILCPENK